MVTVLCGPVAAGKTFLAQRLGREGALVLSCDEMMLTLFDRCLGPEHHDEMALRCLRSLFSVAVQEARLGRDVVVVGNNDKAKIWDAESWKAKKKRELSPEQVAETMLLLGL